jgi:hypothetical protein
MRAQLWLASLKLRERCEYPGTDEDNIKMYLREIWCEDMDWIHLAQDRDRWLAVVNTVLNL